MRFLRQILLCVLLTQVGLAFAQVPVTLPDSEEMDEDGAPITIPVLSNDIDLLSLDPATLDLDQSTDGVQSSIIISGCTLLADASGVVTFTPAANFNGTITNSYTVKNSLGISSLPTLITITVNAVNDAPVAANDLASTSEDTPVSFNIVTNDTDDESINAATVDLDPSTSGRQSSNNIPNIGVFTVDNAGIVTFTPFADYNGSASTQYVVNDNNGVTSNEATITVTITSVNDLPVANNDGAGVTTPEDTPVSLNIINNDTDAEGPVVPSTVDLNTATTDIDASHTNTAGSWVVNTSTGVVTYTPASDYNGTATLTYTVQDNSGATSNQATISITVTPANDLPVAGNDSGLTTPEETALVITILSNDSDPDGTIAANTVDLDPTTPAIDNTYIKADGNGTWNVNASGVVTYTPKADFNGPVSLTYTVQDNSGGTSNVATISVNVTAANDAPVANGDNATTNEETAVSFSVTTNDTDIDGTIAANTVDLDVNTTGIQNAFTTPSVGAWTVSTTGVVTFTPALNFQGSATLPYTVNDNGGATSNQATISVTVVDVNDAPTAGNDAATTNEDTPVTITVLTNDTDGDGTIAANTVDLNTTSGGIQTSYSDDDGSYTVSTSGIVSFTPASNFNGSTTHTYTVNDNDGATSNVATITITVNAVNDAPVAVNDAATTAEETLVTISVLDNDTDADGKATINATSVDLNTATPGIQNANNVSGVGAWTVNTSGVVSFTPATNYNGTATLQYQVNDNSGATSNAATITVTVNPANDAPVAVNDVVTTNEDTPVTKNVVTNDTDADGNGTIAVGTVDLDPATAGIQTSASVSGGGGTITVNASGVITYTPTVNFYGTATASYTVNDNTGATSNIGTITITVNPLNDAPIANNDLTNADENETVTFNVVANDIDIDGTVNPATVDLNVAQAGIQNSATGTGGTFTVNATGEVTYTPTLNYNGTAMIQYRVNDNTGTASNTATFSILVNSVNSLPVAVNDAITINEDATATLSLVGNDSDPDGTINAATVDLNTSLAGIQNSYTVASQGVFSVNGSGVLTFDPVDNFNGTASITYTVNDNVGATSNQATITITVNAVNDAPVANNDVANASDGVAVQINVVANDTDIDGTINVATVDLDVAASGIQTTKTVSGQGTWTVNTSGIVTFTSVANFNNTATLQYRVNDNGGATSNSGTISVTVTAVNDPPVANNDAGTATEDNVLNINVIANDTDPDGSINGSTIDLNPSSPGIQNTITNASGTFAASVASPGIVIYTPASNFTGTATATYTVNDNGGLTSNSATITITVTASNDAPVAVNDAVTTTEDTAVKFDVTANDTDTDGTIDGATVDLNTALAGIQNTNTVTGGTFTASATGEVTFTPTANYYGTAVVSYRVNDDAGATSGAATITVTIQAVNDDPVFDEITPNPQRVLRNGAQKTITITGISAGPGETEQLLLTATSGNTTVIPDPVVTYNGTGATGTLKYQPAANQSGSAEITVKLLDPGFKEFTRTFTIDVVEVKFTSQPVTVAVEAELYQYNITITDVVDNLTIAAVQKPSWATLTIPPTGKNVAVLKGTPPSGAPVSSVVRLQIKDGTTVLDEQQFTLIVNRRPVASSYNLAINEDIATPLVSQDIANSYSDPDGNPIAGIQITGLPRHGNLVLNNATLTQDATIPFASVSNVIYQPAQDYTGHDTIYWKASDGFSYSKVSASINYTIAPVDDPPVITFLETDSLDYDLGSEDAQILTALFEANDVDSDSLTRAEIRFRPDDFEPEHDRLLFTSTPTITGIYNEATGELLLTGKTTIQEYVQAIRTIQYNYIDLEDINLGTKRVTIALSDGESLSTPRDRYIELIYTFEGIDIPNAFTPNGDHANDVWRISASKGVDQYNEAEIKIYSKRGQLLYQSVGFDKAWDGMYNGEILPADTYYYTIDLKYNKIMYKGIVTILR
jgi:gliding motility-associated-like protein